MKGQGSTEYLVILAVVLIVALLVIGLLGQFTGFGTGALEQQSKAYWQAASPFSIQNIKVSGNSVQMDVKNQLSQRVNLTNVSFDAVDIRATSAFFAPGQTATVSGTVSGFNCSAGQPFEFTTVKFTYNQGGISALIQTGDKALVGKCS